MMLLIHFRPITLCKTVYKILTKSLANRLKKVLPLIISNEQIDFILGRSILDSVIIIQELIYYVQRNESQCMLVKIGIQKAYDKANWGFLCKFMEAFGFSKKWIYLILNCISTPKISILINGYPKVFFSISRGIRQGDPISPFLFVVMEEDFGRLTKHS